MWTPTPSTDEGSNIVAFTRFVNEGRGAVASGYTDLWRWSIDEPAAFWSSVVDFFDVRWARAPDSILTSDAMPHTRWFPGGRLNYVAQVFREGRTGIAILAEDEAGAQRSMTWEELERDVAQLAARLQDLGAVSGDRVVGYLPDIPEAIIAFLASASIGAIWAGCGTDLAPEAALARLAQLKPTVLVSATAHRHRGRRVDRRGALSTLTAGLPSLTSVIVVSRDDGPPVPGALAWDDAVAGERQTAPLPMAADHPLWVLFSSGTTGPPKGIVHGHAGVVVEHLKTVALHIECSSGSRFFWYTTLNWMMWNLRNSVLLVGGTVVCFDGAPVGDALWEAAARSRATALGLSPGYLQAGMRVGTRPAIQFDLSHLIFLGCTGSVLPVDVHEWIAAELGPAVLVGPTSGGTDVVTGFAGAVITEPVRAGEIPVRCLGVALESWSPEGVALVGEVGELVVTRPMPSMPVRFWDDADGSRFREAYFDTFPGVWRHGDWVTVTEQGSLVIRGRSDATLNRHGIRMGSADIYRAAELLPEVTEALVVGLEEPDGGYWMPMFVALAPDASLDERLIETIRGRVRDMVSPRHVPDEILQVPAIPHTLTGKKLEIPVKRLLAGIALGAEQTAAVDDPALLTFYSEIGEQRRRSSIQAASTGA